LKAWIQRRDEPAVHEGGRLPRNAKLIFARLLLGCAAVAFLLLFSLRSVADSKPAPPQDSQKVSAPPASSKTLSDAEMARMSSADLTSYVFNHDGCTNCHTLAAHGKLGYTERGQQLAKGFEGCISMLTSMNLIAQTAPAYRTPDEKKEIGKFQEFGCTTCHQFSEGATSITKLGAKLTPMHLSCTVTLCCTPHKK
jgi:cytochrome c551/c552